MKKDDDKNDKPDNLTQTLSTDDGANFYPLPDQVPLAEARRLLGHFKGQAFDARLDVHAAWSVLGYAQRQFADAQPLTQDEARRQSHQHFDAEQTLTALAGENAKGQQALSIPWKMLASWALSQLQTWLGSL